MSFPSNLLTLLFFDIIVNRFARVGYLVLERVFGVPYPWNNKLADKFPGLAAATHDARVARVLRSWKRLAALVAGVLSPTLPRDCEQQLQELVRQYRQARRLVRLLDCIALYSF